MSPSAKDLSKLNAEEFFRLWEKHPPAFLAHIKTGAFSGSGIQVGAHHVVTCAHVLIDARDAYRLYQAGADRPDVTKQTALVSFRGFETRGVVIAQDASLDLALLELDKVRPGIIAPLVARADYQGEARVVGIRRESERFISLHHPITIDQKASSEGGRHSQVKHKYGAKEGTSGGGVFAYDQGTLLYVGTPTLGGELANMGAYIPAEAVFDFLREILGFEQPRYPERPHARSLWSSGFAPAWELKAIDPPLILTFGAVTTEAAGSPHTSFVARRVVSASQMRLGTPARTPPGHRRLPAWAKTVEQAEEAVRRLGNILGWNLRLPTVQELEIAWQTATPTRMPRGRPLALSDFKANETGFDVPPSGALEWARDHNGHACAVESCKGDDGVYAYSLTPEEAQDREPGFRVAFDVGST